MTAIGISFAGHALLIVLFVSTIVWQRWEKPKVYVVNLVPAVAMLGSPVAPLRAPPMPAKPSPVEPSRAPAPAPTPEPRERAMRDAPKLPAAPATLPDPALPTRSLPPRTAALRAGEKELPVMAAPKPAPRVEKPDKVDRPVQSRPAPAPPRGLPTGSPSGAHALTVDASDFPHAWYLRQVLQKVQSEWQRQNQRTEPGQKPLVFVEIQRDGSIRIPVIEQSSGSSNYDQAALRAIVEASPFPPLPQEWSRPSLRVVFRFDLERG